MYDFTDIVRSAVADPGTPLPASTRARAERRLSHDLSDVVVHRGPRPAAAAAALDARGFAYGRHVVLGAGDDALHSGNAVLEHELTHVAQARASAPDAVPQRVAVASPDHPAEHAARSGTAGTASPAVPTVFRFPRGSADPMHDALVEEYRRRHGLPPRGVDESGMRVGPSDDVIKYGLAPRDAAYRLPLDRVQRIDPLIHGFLSRVGLGGSRRSVRHGTLKTADTPPVRLSYDFTLAIPIGALPAGVNAQFEINAHPPTGVGTVRHFAADMTITIRDPERTDSEALARDLYHEGIHLLLAMDGLIPLPGAGATHPRGLATYTKIANAHPEWQAVGREIQAHLTRDFAKHNVPRTAQEVAGDRDAMLANVLEEKYAFDQERTPFGRAGSNTEIASRYLTRAFWLVKSTVPGASELATMIARVRAVFDAIDSRPATP